MPSLVPADRPLYDLDLLRTLRGTRLAGSLRVLAVIGAHRFDEAALIDKLFPGLQRIYAFEPLAAPLAALRARAAADPRLTVFDCAVSDRDGTADFHVTDNDGESSSLLDLGRHRELFPHVGVARTIRVTTRRLDSVLAERALPGPDALIVDVQGAEHHVLSSIPPALMAGVRLIYTEVSREPLYDGARLLPDVEAVLAPRFVNLGYAPISPAVPVHGNAVFVAREDVAAVFDIATSEQLRRGLHGVRRRLRGR
jgi:FkbM family methyltransferase